MAKVVINNVHGGFGLSPAAFARLKEMGNKHALEETDVGEFYSDGSGPRESWGGLESFCRDIPRNDPDLIAVVEEMGEAASSKLANLKVVEIPDDVEWQIEEYDGLEWIAEKRRTWG